jgi:hypothetical protein
MLAPTRTLLAWLQVLAEAARGAFQARQRRVDYRLFFVKSEIRSSSNSAREGRVRPCDASLHVSAMSMLASEQMAGQGWLIFIGL